MTQCWRAEFLTVQTATLVLDLRLVLTVFPSYHNMICVSLAVMPFRLTIRRGNIQRLAMEFMEIFGWQPA